MLQSEEEPAQTPAPEPPAVRRWGARFQRRRLVVAAATVAALVALYAALGFLLLPYVAQQRIPQLLSDKLGLQASIGELRFNPFLLRAAARDVRLAQADRAPLVSAGELVVDLQTSSLFRRAWTFSELRAEDLNLQLEIGADGRPNWPSLPRTAAEPDAGPPRLIVQRIEVRGQVRVADLSEAEPARATLTDLDIRLNDIATLPDTEGRYSIEADLPAGGKLNWIGSLSLQPLHSAGELRIVGLQAATLWSFWRDRLKLREPKGTLTASTRYEFARASGALSLKLHDTALRLADLALTREGGDAPLLTLKAIDARGGRFDLAAREVVLPQLTLQGGTVAVQVDAKGSVDWQTLLAAPAPTPKLQSPAPAAPQQAPQTKQAPRSAQASSPQQAPSASAASTQQAPQKQPQPQVAAAPWRVTLEALQLDKVAVRTVDRSRATPLAFDVGALKASTKLALSIGTSATAFKASNLEARAEQVALRNVTTAATKAATTAATPAPTPAATTAAPAALLSLPSITLKGGALDSSERKLGASELLVQGGRLELERASDGTLNLAQTFAAAAAPGAKPAPAAAPAAAATPRWHYALGTLRLAGTELALRDRGYQPAVAYQVQVDEARLENIDSSTSTPLKFDAKLRVAEGGTITASGTAAPDFATADAELRVDALALRPLQPMLARRAALTLQSGTLSGNAKLGLRKEGERSALRAGAEASIAGLRIDESKSGDRFLSWKTLKASGINYDSARARLGIRQIDLIEPGAKIAITASREVNIVQAFKADATATPATPPKPAEVAADAAPPLQTRIGRVQIQQGVVDYADLSLVLPFSTRIKALNGSVLDIASGRERRAQVQANGEIDPFGSASVEGSLTPFEPKHFLDLRVRMNNVEMPPLSPYTATFAGRKVAEGKLSLDVQYRIADSQLLGENKVRLADFKLGERVEAPRALDLPLDLAIALLTDDQGRIDVTVPVRGDVSKPSFEIGTLIREAVGNLLRRIVTAPFRAIGRLVGGAGGEDDGDDKLAQIGFAPGSAALQPEEREKLQQIAASIAQRPQLKLVVQGPYAEQQDGAALRARKARRELAEALGETLPPGDELAPIGYGSRRTQAELVRMAGKYAGEEAVRELKARPRKPAPDAAASSSARDADRELYAEMFERIVAAIPLDAAELQALANRRAGAMRDSLVGAAATPAERVEVRPPQRVAKEAEGAVVTTLQLQATGKPA